MQNQPGAPKNQPNRPALTHSTFALRVLIATGIVLTIVLLLWLLGRAVTVFLVLFAAVLFGVLLYNLSRHVHRLSKLPYSWALMVVVVLLFGILVGGGVLLAPYLATQGEELAKELPKAFDNLKGQISNLPFGERILQGLPNQEELSKSQNGIMQRVFGAFSTTLGALANLFIIIVIGIYLAANPGSSTEGVVKLFPIKARQRTREVLYTLGSTLWGWLKATLLAMVLIGTVISIGLSVIGIPLPFILGVIAGLFEFVPNIGPFIAGAPAVLLALLSGPGKALWVIVLFVVVQSLEGWVLTPMLQKKVIDLPPVLTLSAQLLLGMLAGFMGLILAVPLMAVLMVLVKMVYIEDILGDRNIEVKGEEQAKHQVSDHEAEESQA